MMRLFKLITAVGVISLGVMGAASSHTQSKHGPTRHVVAAHAHAHAAAKKGGWHAPKAALHPPGTGHGKGYHAPRAPHSWKHYKAPHKTYHRPAPPPRVPGRTSDGRYMLPGGLESVCAGGTPPPCQ